MAQDLADAECLTGAKQIYSMWPGYLERGSHNLRNWCRDHKVGFEIVHTSGHADAKDLKRLINAVRPKRLIPIHTIVPEKFNDLGIETTLFGDGRWNEI